MGGYDGKVSNRLMAPLRLSVAPLLPVDFVPRSRTTTGLGLDQSDAAYRSLGPTALLFMLLKKGCHLI
jgi:hypothetical protein